MGDDQMAEDKKKLIEFLLALEVDPEIAREYAADANGRASVVDRWQFGDELAKALKDRNVEGVEKYMNPGSILMKGWIKAPGS